MCSDRHLERRFSPSLTSDSSNIVGRLVSKNCRSAPDLKTEWTPLTFQAAIVIRSGLRGRSNASEIALACVGSVNASWTDGLKINGWNRACRDRLVIKLETKNRGF